MKIQSLLFMAVWMLPASLIAEDNVISLFRIPKDSTAITVDGKLDEPCYAEHQPLKAFVVAGDKNQEAPSTEAWLFWNEERLVCAFRCADATLAAAPPVNNERDVDNQDRGELFLWAGSPKEEYYCIEAAPESALHDYKARFYRKFEDAWSPGGDWECKALATPGGYTLEMALPRDSLKAMGISLQGGTRFRVGLFRADYDVYGGKPTWITWIDHGREPDFHVADSFGTAELLPKRKRSISL